MFDQTAHAHGRPGRDAAGGLRPARVARLCSGGEPMICCEALEPRVLLAVAFTGSTIGLQGEQPTAVVAADFNGDGVPDLAVANASTNDVSILLTGAAGTLGTPVQVGVGSGPRGMAAGDVDGDGDLDLVVANSLGSTVTVLVNVGGGVLVRGADLDVSSGPRAVVVGDFTRDGIPDIAVAVFATSRVALLRGLGGGAFAAPTFTSVGAGPVAMAAADVDLDGDLDLAVVGITGGDVTLLRNNSWGAFSTAATIEVGSVPRGIVATDFDGDGDPDFAVSNSFSGTVSVLLNTNRGVLTERGQYFVGEQPYGIVAGDFDRDGRADIATANLFSNDISVLTGDGHGVLGAPERFSAGAGPMGLAAADFNGDGFTDLVAANSLADSLRLLRGRTPQPNVAPVIGVLTATPTPAVRGQVLTLTADDVGDVDGIVAEVRFYRDTNGSGDLDPNDQQLGIDTTVSNGWTWSGVVPAAWGTGGARFFAQAFDNDGAPGNLAMVELTILAPPVIGSLTASVTQVSPGGALTLTATGVTDADGSVQSVRFYRDANGNGILDAQDQLLFEDTSGADGYAWSGTADPAWGPAVVRYFAQAVDNGGLRSEVRSVTVAQSVPPTIGSAITLTPVIIFGSPVGLMALDPADEDGTVAAVSFWYDVDADGTISEADVLLGTDTFGGDGFMYHGEVPFEAGLFGPVQFLVRPVDNIGVVGEAIVVGAELHHAPMLEALEASSSRVGTGDTITLTTTATDVDGPSVSVMFYRDVNGNGYLDMGDTWLGTDSDGADGFSIEVAVPSGWGPAENTFLAQAMDGDLHLSIVRSVRVLINDFATMEEFSASLETVRYFDPLFLTAAGTDDPDGFVTAVRFYRDDDGNGVVSEGDALLAEVTDSVEGVFDVMLTVDPLEGGWRAGLVTLLAVPVDDLGSDGVVESLQLMVLGVPLIDALAAPAIVRTGTEFTLEAVNVRDDDGEVVAVQIYRDSNGSGVLDAGDQLLSDGPASWTGVASPAWGRGVQRFFAVAVDDDELESPVVTTQVVIGLPPVVVDISVSPSPVAVGAVLTVTIIGVTDSDPLGTIQTVRLFRDADDDGVLDPEEQTGDLVAPALAPGLHRAEIVVPAEWGGTTTRLFAVSVNDLGIFSDPISTTFIVTQPPVIDALLPTDVQPMIGSPLSLVAVIGEGGPVTHVRFYRDSNGSGGLEEGDEVLFTDEEGPQFAWTGQANAAWGAGPQRFFAVAFGPGGAVSEVATLALDVWTSVYFPEGWRNDTTVNEYVPLVNPHPFPVMYRVLAHYEVGERDEVIAAGILPPRSRGGITVTERGRGNEALTRLNVGYALEVQSSAEIGALLSRYDNFSPGGSGDDAATGEAFTSVTSTVWTFPDVIRSPGEVFDFLLYYNPTDTDGSVTFTLYYEDGTVHQFTWGAAAKRRGGVNFNAEDLPVGHFAVVATASVPLVMAHSRYEALFGRGFTALGGVGTGELDVTLPYFDTRDNSSGVLALFNPDPVRAATVRIVRSFHTEDGLESLADEQITVHVPAQRPLRITPDALLSARAGRVTIRLESDLPIAVQLSASDAIRGDATGAGVNAAGRTAVLFADAFLDRDTAGIVGFEELALHNPSDTAVLVRVVFYYSDGSAPGQIDVTLEARESRTIDLHAPGSPALKDALNFYSLGVFADAPVLALLTHWDLFQNGGWSTFGSPLTGPPS